MAAQTLSEVADTHWSATQRSVDSKVVDNYFKRVSTLDKMRKSALQVTDTGGRGIQVTARLSGGFADSFDSYDELNKAPINPVQSAFYSKRYYYSPIILSDTESWENTGAQKRFDEMKELGEVAMETILAAINADFYTAQAGKNMLGFPDIIADAAGATIGGINSGSTTKWENQRQTSAKTFLTQTTTNIFDGLTQWNLLLDDCHKNKGRPKLLFTTYSIVGAYRIALSSQGYARTTVEDAGGGVGGSRNPDFYDLEVIPEVDCTALHCYMVDPDAFKFHVMKNVNFRKTPFVSLQSNGQLAQLAYMVAGVQSTTRARRANGVHTAITGV